MSQKKYDYEVLRISGDYKEMLDTLFKDSNCASRKEYTERMILYFKETGIDPMVRNKNTADELSKLRNTVISFIKEQEKSKLEPIIGQLNDLTGYLMNFLKSEALTKSDLARLNASSPNIVQVQKSEIPKDRSNEKAKEIFEEFTKHLKPSTFSSALTVDKTTVNHYKDIFAKL